MPDTDPLLPVLARGHLGVLRVLDAAVARLRDPRGQGTVEYVALVLLIAGVFAAVVKTASKSDGGIAQSVVKKVKTAIDTSGGR